MYTALIFSHHDVYRSLSALPIISLSW